MVARARATRGVSVLLDPHTVLPPSFAEFVVYLSQLEHDWLLTASTLNVNTSSKPEQAGSPVQLWAWNAGRTPLHAGVLPPFIYGAGFHDQWLLSEVLNSNFRVVIDGSQVILPLATENSDRSNMNEFRTGDAERNAYLSQIYGSFVFRPTGLQDVWAKLGLCGSRPCLTHEEGKRTNPARTQELSQRKTSWKYAKKSLSMESLLAKVASRSRVAILTVVSSNYRDMLMSWVCRLRHLNITNFLVAAVDEELHKFGLLQGLPVFKLEPASITSEDCSFGSSCFRRVTKLKSRTVLRALELGYHVLFSDVDVYWFTNPIMELTSFGPGVLAAQTDEYNETEPVNLPRRLNSGFYLAWSDNATILAFRKIVEHAAKSKLSEQPSFYDVLCGEEGRFRVGDSMCLEPETKVSVKFLDRMRFPNGGYRLIWEATDVKETCRSYGCIILHNNWKTGSQQKIQRQMSKGLWDYDPETRMCAWEWMNENSRHFY